MKTWQWIAIAIAAVVLIATIVLYFTIPVFAYATAGLLVGLLGGFIGGYAVCKNEKD